MVFDWFTSDNEARQALYEVTKRAVASRFLGDWNAFLHAALDGQASVGTGYVDNFRAGRISRVRAGAIARWLEEYEPMLALELDQRLRALSGEKDTSWDRLVRDRGATDCLSIVKIDHLRIVSFAGASADAITTLRRGEAFCLRLKSAQAGQALGLQRSGALWFPLPLAEGALVSAVEAGTQFLPRTGAGDVLPLSEESDTGPAEFVVIVSAQPWLDAYAQSLALSQPIDVENLTRQVTNDPHVELYRTSAMII